MKRKVIKHTFPNWANICNPLDTKIIIINSTDMRITSYNVFNGTYTTQNLNSMMPNDLNVYKIQGVLIMNNDIKTKLVVNELSKKIKFVIVQNGLRHSRKNCISVNTNVIDFNSINLLLGQIGRKPVLDYNIT
jgi:hypothetical protein